MLRICLLFSVTISCLILLSVCQSRQATSTVSPPTVSQLTGKQLAATYCGSCHLLPEPSLLPKVIWEKRILPLMALRLGFSVDSISPFITISDADEINRVMQGGVFPGSPLLHVDDWKKIVQYYVANAPATPLPQAAKPAVVTDLPLFQVRSSINHLTASITLLRYDTLNRLILAGNGQGKLLMLDSHLNVIDSTQVGSPPTDIRARSDKAFDVLTAGNMEPNDLLSGKWQRINFPNHPSTKPSAGNQLLIDSLARPVSASFADFNQDGQEDVVICQFGNYVGQLSWFQRDGTLYRQYLLDQVPGARRTIVKDVNQDGRPDIVALLSQGDEQIAIFYNDGGGRFTKDVVLRFPSVYGSSYVDLTDMDHDGDLDILYTNGDNGDKSYSLKAYHGVRVFLNDGHFKFTKSLFYPLFGAAQAIARDFDQDGDVDIAAISFFPDYDKQPVESFVYLENQGNFRMKARTFPHPEQGHWIVMEAADVDQDGDDDLVLGSFFRAITPTPQSLREQWFKAGKGVLLLENQKRKPGPIARVNR